ncbi:Diphthamide biosynthesis protein 3 [Diplonema papillatum]|nr:Diphthamide biosynthesis protein 3 [Diplonema papillatum]
MLEADTVAIKPEDVKEDHDIYEEVPLAKMEWLEDEGLFAYDCPCGDLFTATKEELRNGQCVLVCPTCSLAVRVVEIDEQLLR